MKYFLCGIFMFMLLPFCYSQNLSKLTDTALLEPVEIKAIRATENTPVAKMTLSRTEIEKKNIGQDLPFILNQTPAVIVNSDAGNGIGYTGIRIRGSDATRINVSLNGIPYNDAESQGTFFVDLPDIASSAGSIQVQRGVGTSSNGAGAFGGSINVSTNEIITKRALQFISNAGSYSSFRNTLMLNSGLLRNHFTFDARLSDITSNGYIDRSHSKLRSYFLSGAVIGKKNSLRLNIFSGHEKTQQAWYGIDSATLANNRRFNPAGTEKAGAPYENQVDNYTQTHYQLFYNRKFNHYWKGNLAFFLTHGKGYYEEYKADQALSAYALPLYIDGADTIDQTDLVRRLWLDNNFYGSTFSLQFDKRATGVIIGGSINKYDGKHFGEIIHATVQAAVPVNYRWYDLKAHKEDFSAYAKWTQKLGKNFQSFIDIQVRNVSYNLYGFSENPTLTVMNNYFFFNPKAGITYTKNKFLAYLSYAPGAKEPNRDDFETGALQQPSAEYLNDYEAAVEYRTKRSAFDLTVYYMKYKNQLVLTGKINDVGAYTRTNIPDSYRSGIELQGTIKFNRLISFNGNISLSENKINRFTEYLDDYDNGGQAVNFYRKTSISFSPAVVASGSINLFPFKNSEINCLGKYVSKQYLDNTANNSRLLKRYFVEDVRLNYLINLRHSASLRLFLQGNNIFSKKYEANGYSFSYIYNGSLTTENYYFPMAPFNFMAGVAVKL